MPKISFPKVLSHNEVRELLPRLVSGELSVEQRGRVEGHILMCEECAVAFGDEIAAAMEREEAIEEVEFSLFPELVPLPPLYPSFSAAKEGKVGILWTKVKECAEQGERWAQEKLQELLDLLQSTMALWRPLWEPTMALVPVPTLGVKGVDASWQPLEEFAFEVEQEPVITKDGEFHLMLCTTAPELQGRKVICTLELVEGGLLSFEATVEDELVCFTANGFPTGDADIPIPQERLRFYVAPLGEE
jgi:hypothetical protein